VEAAPARGGGAGVKAVVAAGARGGAGGMSSEDAAVEIVGDPDLSKPPPAANVPSLATVAVAGAAAEARGATTLAKVPVMTAVGAGCLTSGAVGAVMGAEALANMCGAEEDAAGDADTTPSADLAVTGDAEEAKVVADTSNARDEFSGLLGGETMAGPKTAAAIAPTGAPALAAAATAGGMEADIGEVSWAASALGCFSRGSDGLNSQTMWF